MQVETVEISTLSSDPANVRRHSARNVEAVKASLRRFGQQIPLVVDAQNVVRVGNYPHALDTDPTRHRSLVARRRDRAPHTRNR
jgi:hypothetical protein